MSDVIWHAAATEIGYPKERRVDGWPDVFSLTAIAMLQYPKKGSDSEKREAQKKRNTILGAMKSAISEGMLMSVEIEKDYIKVDLLKSWSKRHGLPASTDDLGGANKKTEPGLSRAAFAAWWAKQGAQSSEFIVGWVGGSSSGSSINLPDFDLSQAGVKKTFNEGVCGITETQWRGLFGREDTNGLESCKNDHIKGNPIYSAKKIALWLVKEGKCNVSQIKKALGDYVETKTVAGNWSQLTGEQ